MSQEREQIIKENQLKAETQTIRLSIQLPIHLYQKIQTQARNLNLENSKYFENIIAEYFNDPIQEKIETFFNNKIIFKDYGCEDVDYVYECFLKYSKISELSINKFIRLIKSQDNRIELTRTRVIGKEKTIDVFSGIWINREAAE
jgi:hypothetical protein